MASEKVTILDISFDNYTRREFLEKLHKRIQKEEKTFVVTANPEIVMYARTHPDYAAILSEADFITPDGIGVVKAAQSLQTPIKERVPGFDLMLDLLNLANEKAYRVYFLGAKEEVSQKTVEVVAQKWPQIVIAGSHHGYFDHTDTKRMHEIKETQPDILLAALGFPRQEEWIHRYFQLADKGLAMGVGGSFDVLSGTAKRAPKLVRKFHIEWLYRLIKQPSRWKRMLALPQFMREVRHQKRKNEYKIGEK